MKHLKLLSAVIAFSFALLTGCKNEFETDSAVNPSQVQMANKKAVKEGPQLSAALKEKLAKFRSSLPAGSAKGIKQNATSMEFHPEYRAMIRKALGVIEPTTCDGDTQLDQWLGEQFVGWNQEMVDYLYDFAMLDLPTYDAYVFENSSADQYFGQKGEYTQRLTKTFKDLKRFWDIESDEMVMVAMHGNMLLNRERIIRTYVAAYGVEPTEAAELADIVIMLVEAIPQYRNGTHPIFTFNAFALPGFNFGPYGIIPDKIVMGDGILEAFTGIGFGDIAPQAILAHEFGHQIQFQYGYIGEESSPEAGRRVELMADAYAAYYLSHARGASMQWKRVQQFLQVFYNLGDCSFDSDGHHGTPAERMAVAEWAYNLANNAQKQGHILSIEEFTRLFEAQLPQLVMR